MAARSPVPKNSPKRSGGRFLDRVRSQREAQILEAATLVLLRKGCRAFRVDDVTAACGIAKGTCYNHFGSQTGLIATTVRQLDEGFATRLASPPSNLTEPRQILEWAVLQAVDAEIVTVTQRSSRAQAGAGALNGNAWPCCLGVLPCPYGGDEGRSHNALLHWTNDLKSSKRVRRSLHLTLLLAVVPTLCLGLDRHDKLPNPHTIRSLVRQLFKHLYPPETLDRGSK